MLQKKMLDTAQRADKTRPRVRKEILVYPRASTRSENVLSFLEDKVSGIEKIIKDEVSALEKELLKEIKSFKSK
ncbi:MAG: hypothetical protein Q8P25_00520 [Candidatus Curtissbacteria bacterium]|nr:hypothetical protein [Candidatus Curtissbacteria bacterium]